VKREIVVLDARDAEAPIVQIKFKPEFGFPDCQPTQRPTPLPRFLDKIVLDSFGPQANEWQVQADANRRYVPTPPDGKPAGREADPDSPCRQVEGQIFGDAYGV
jgi:hypothetical protein